MIKISDILHHAADHCLAVDGAECDRDIHKHWFSCVAIEGAIETLLKTDNPWDHPMNYRIHDGLEAMGLDPQSGGAFDQWHYTEANLQQARYGWLKLAALMAEEQGQ